MISQAKDDTLELPAGVGFTMDAEQFVRLEFHFANSSDAPSVASARATFTAIDEQDFQNEAGLLLLETIDIDIPASSLFTLGSAYIAEPATLAGSTYFGVVGFEHLRGTGVTVSTTSGQAGADTTLYNPPAFTWDAPPVVYHDPPVTVPEGGGFRLTCSWQNDGSRPVRFGETTNDEQCLAALYYYPNKGSQVCMHTDAIGGGVDVCCPGGALCDQLW